MFNKSKRSEIPVIDFYTSFQNKSGAGQMGFQLNKLSEVASTHLSIRHSCYTGRDMKVEDLE